ncbi:MAG: Uncharacterised protein [Synechococcus sp. CC9902]|nr:MAG: Uncharacterised protein [Synechococcus sp. CC9902]
MFLDRRTHLLGGVGVELLQPDVTNLRSAVRTGVQAFRYGIDLDPCPFQRHVDHGSLASQTENNLGTLRTTNQFHGVLRVHPLGAFAIDGDDHILGLNPGTRSRCPLNRSNNNELLGLLVEAQLNANPTQFTGGVDLHFLEFLRIQETRVGIIEAGKHASDRFVRLPCPGVGLRQKTLAQLTPSA